MKRSKAHNRIQGSTERPKPDPEASDGTGSDLPVPRGLAASTVDLGGEQYLVLSFPMPAWSLPAGLSVAEREVALAVLRGETNDTIARERNTSIRTVANQIAAVFAKLGVNSRIELALAVGTSNSDDAGK
jgi:DNA-binding NarL/FixJ family response regulator